MRLKKIRPPIPGEIEAVAEEGYVYGYPLVLMDITRRLHTATPFPTAHGAPMNQFAHNRFVPGPHSRDTSRPYADSLRSGAWLDLSKEPVILTVPATDRYFLLSLLSAWGDLFNAISPRTIGMGGDCFAIVGPRWSGDLTGDMRQIFAPTDVVWINGRIQAAGVEDVQIVHGVQDQLKLTLLSDWDKRTVQPHTGPFRMTADHQSSPEETVSGLSAPAFFTRLSRLLSRHSPQAGDAAIIGRLATIGFLPSEDFSFDALPFSVKQAMYAAVAAARMKISSAKTLGRPVNNWMLRVHPGRFDTDYLSRAVAIQNMFWSSLAEDVVAYQAAIDFTGAALRGTNQYVIHFDQEDIPPVNAFWSITVYDSRHSLAANVIHRHVIGDHCRLRLNSDNSLSIYLQHEWPGTGKDSNWLPVPRDAFDVILQLYWPKPEVLNGIWRPPAVMRVY